MIQPVESYLLCFSMGGVLGGVYFITLWITVRKLPTMAGKGAWLFGSFLVRTAAVLTGFYIVMDGDWKQLLAAMSGFVLIRFLIVRRIKPVRRAGRSKGRGETFVF